MTVDPVVPPTEPSTPVDDFAGFGLSEAILKGVREAGFVTASPIQKRAIPLVLSGRDLIAQAQTGTGKTAAFGLPAMSRMKTGPGVQILVVTPTRELAAQVSEELFKLGRFAGARTAAVYGGQSSWRQVDLINRGAQIVVATPGRLLDHLDAGRLKGFTPATVIIDEADEMLDMGFLEDLERIFKHLPAERQTLMFSATMPPPIKALANRILKQPATIDLTGTPTFQTDVTQYFYVIEERERCEALARIIDHEEPPKSIVFCRTKRETDELANILNARGLGVRVLHGDIEQRQRQDTIAAFKRGDAEILVATDVAARGLDVSDVSHVFNYHLPFDQEAYVHRIGRTGRAGKKGKAITLVTPFEFRKLRRIQHAIKASFIHGEVPSVADVHKRHDVKLVKVVCEQVMNPRAVDVLAALSEEMDVTEAACKLISMLVAKRSVRGPEKIGLTGNQVQKLMGGGGGGGGGSDRPHQGGSYGRKPFQGKKPYPPKPPFGKKPFRRDG